MRRIHGVMSLGFVLAAVCGALWGAFQSSLVYGVVYSVAAGVSFFALLASFCAGCPCRKRCGHVFPGPIAAALFPGRVPAPYSRTALVVSSIALVLLLITPLVWLWRDLPLLALFIGLLLIATLQIRTRVCRGCGNEHCPANKHV